MSIEKAKQTILSIWTPYDVGRVFATEEKLDRQLAGWKDWIVRFTDEDFSNAENAIREDIVNEVRGHDLDRPSVSALLQYCKAAKRIRDSLAANKDQERRDRTPEEKEADQKSIKQIMGMLSND